jgi:hypothetical protein
MPSLRGQTAREELMRRLERITPLTRPKWGGLDAPRMLCHLGDTLAMALGELAAQPMNRKAFHHFPLKHLIIYALPFPKGAPTSPELLSTAPQNFDADRRRVVECINRLAAAPTANGPEHPLFGPLTNEEWNVLQWKHINHHLRQFGC